MAGRNRILTSHVGALPRPATFQDGRNAYDRPEVLSAAVNDVVAKQLAAGLDIINDGELGKSSFVSYISERLSGFEDSTAPRVGWRESREGLAFPEFYQPRGSRQISKMCTGPIAYIGAEQIQIEIRNLLNATKGKEPEGLFLPAPSPASVASFWPVNNHYATQEGYLYAIADALKEEYKAVTGAGIQIQIDDPWTATHYVLHPELSIEECRAFAESAVEAVNYALAGIPREMVRYHTCYGINMGPRIHDLEMKEYLDIVLKVNASVLSFEAANPRHEHEWTLWERAKLPDGMSIMPGVITHTSFLVEHPELVCQRLVRFAGAVGRERVIAGADCGFAATAQAADRIEEKIVWEKMRSLVAGTQIANSALWPKAASSNAN